MVNKDWNKVNPTHTLTSKSTEDIGWVKENTAMLVVHGIGDQRPLETLDMFARGLVKQYKNAFPKKIKLTHQIVTKPTHGDTPWFDNAVRINLTGSDFHIDIYEYYWANYTEDKAEWNDLNSWLQGVVSGAGKFYKQNKALGVSYDKGSYFFTKDGKFRKGRYNFFIQLVSKTFILINLITTGLLKMVSYFPVIGELASTLLKSFFKSGMHKFTNVIGDIVVYNVTDPKSKFYEVRRCILDGAVNSLKFLIERETDDKLDYPSVIVAGHSLGTQIAYDAINKLDLLVNKNEIKNYGADGLHHKSKLSITNQLKGFVSFGSPLDKIAFFLREMVPDEKYLRQQLLDNYHGFKQRNWSLNTSDENGFTKLPQPISRLFDDIKWRNYFDRHDYVSGSLDYYMNLENLDCNFKSGLLGFTHSYYWQHDLFYQDLIFHFLSDKQKN